MWILCGMMPLSCFLSHHYHKLNDVCLSLSFFLLKGIEIWGVTCMGSEEDKHYIEVEGEGGGQRSFTVKYLSWTISKSTKKKT